MQKRILAGLVLAAVSGWTTAAHAADFLEYYHEALAHDPVYASARDALTAGREKYPEGRSGLLPNVIATGNISANETTIIQPGFPAFSFGYPAHGFGVQLTQPLFRWANWQQYKQGELQVSLAEAQFAQAQQDLVVRLAQAYFDVLVARDSIEFLRAQKAAISEQLASAQRNFEVGTATITDTKEAQSRYDLAVSQEIAAESDLEVKRSVLQEIIGKPPGDLEGLRPGVKLSPPEPSALTPWVTAAEEHSPQVAQSSAALEIAQRQIEVSRSEHLPTLDVVVSRTYERQPSLSILPPQAGNQGVNSAGIQLSVPLFSGGLASAHVRESVALRDKAESDLETARRQAALNARQAFVGVTSGLAQVKALEAAEISSQSSLDSNKVGYQVGVRINIDVLNAQQQLYSTERDLSKARYDTLLNSLKLKSATGSLQESDVQAINALLTH